MMIRPTALILAIGMATTALAHSGVTNATVKARMDGMEALAAHSKTLGNGLKEGASRSDMTAAAKALRRESERVKALFKPEEDDPRSDSRAEIWTNWADFAAKADALVVAAETLEAGPNAAARRDAFRAVAQACTACHKHYRE